MKAYILAEDSNTFNEESEIALDYFAGQFRPVAQLYRELSELVETEMDILSEEFGLINASQTIPQDSTELSENVASVASNRLLEASSNSDVVVLLLTKDKFEEVVQNQWEDLVSNSVQGSIWCLAASTSALKNCDRDSLEQKVDTVLVYPRLGVAPIDRETREELLQTVEQRALRD